MALSSFIISQAIKIMPKEEKRHTKQEQLGACWRIRANNVGMIDWRMFSFETESWKASFLDLII